MSKVNLGRVVGADGKGISKIEKTATNGLVDTYTITYTDNTTSTYTVTNGQDGSSGGGTNVLYTFLDAYVSWCKGESFPIAFYGDSTFAGYNTSGVGYRLSDVLQTLLREECGNDAPVVYNGATSGHTFDNAINDFDNYFGKNGRYADTKMLFIGYGINDRLYYKTFKDYKIGVYTKLENLINKCYARNIQPVLVTSQATTECGVGSGHINIYPLRDSNSINVCANGAKKELAKKYDIPLIDLNKFTELFLLNSSYDVKTIISDQLHFGDLGNAYEGGVLFKSIVPRTITIKNNDRYIINYANQNLRYCVRQEKLSYGGDLKVYTNYKKSDTTDTKIMDAYVFIQDYIASIEAHKNEGGATYVKIDNVVKILEDNVTDLGTLELGLHHLEVFTGESTSVNFAGFILNNKTNIEIEEVPVTSVTIDKETLTFNNWETQTLIATVEPSNTTDKIEWSSSNSQVATVKNGIVTPVGNGTCNITVKVGDITKICSVTVNITITLTSISATYNGGAVGVGTSLGDLTNLTVIATYSDSSTKPVTGYTLSGEILEGENTITVSYEGLTTTFVVVGKTETGGDDNISASLLFDTTDDYEMTMTAENSNVIVPSAIMFGFNLDTKTSDLDNTTITKLVLPIEKEGNFTIAKTKLSDYGTRNMTIIQSKTYTVNTTGEITLDNLVIESGETLIIGSTNDTAKFRYGTTKGDTSLDKLGRLLTSSAFKNKQAQEIVIACQIYGYKN